MTDSTQQQPLSLLRLPAVTARVGLGRSSIYSRIRRGDFPAPIQIGDAGPNAKRKPIVAWSSAAIDSWVAAQVAKSRASEA